MTPADYERVKEIFLAALECAPQERDAFVQQACADDVALRARVEQLLAADAYDEDEDGSDPATARDLGTATRAAMPERIGKYRVVRLVGHGAMGDVYEAHQEAPHRRVALKVIRAGLAWGDFVRRFEQEAQLLSRLRHPGIAQIYEAGTAEIGSVAQPFFAMEFVEGRAIHEFAQAYHLSTSQRVELLARVCDGVEHAHQKGVIHRDLKPANVLVEGAPGDGDAAGTNGLRAQPKILDFGVARAIDADTPGGVQTLAGQLIGTLPYMSPEQVDGDPARIDTRSDVYALGVLGYELLTGRLPVEVADKSLVEAARLIRDKPPAPLELGDRSLRNDLAIVLGKALAKDKEQRYASASQLAADLRRVVANEPITARPPTARYQLRMFARRNPALVGSLVAAFIILAAGVVGTSYGFWQAMRQRDAAVRARNQLALAKRDAEREADRARAAEAQALSEQAETQAVSDFILRVFATARPAEEGRDISVVEAMDIAAQELETAALKPTIRATLHAELAVNYQKLGRLESALKHARRAYEMQLEALGAHHPDTLSAMNNLAFMLIAPQNAERLEQAQALIEQLLQLADEAPDTNRDTVLSAMSNLASVHWYLGDYARAEAITTRLLGETEQAYGPDHPSTLSQRENLAFLVGRHDPQRKLELLRQVLRGRERSQGAEHPATMRTRQKVARALSLLGRDAEALPLFEETVRQMQTVLSEAHPDTIIARHHMGLCLFALGRYADAQRTMRKTLELARTHLGETHHVTLSATSVLAEALCSTDQFAEASPLFCAHADTLAALRGRDDPATLHSRAWCAICLLETGEVDRAQQIIDQVAEQVGDAGPLDASTAMVHVARARVLMRQGDDETAAALLEPAIAALSPGAGDRAFGLRSMIEVCERLGREAEADGWREKLAAIQEARRR